MADKPVPWQMLLQEPASPMMEKLNGLHDLLLIIITGITVFVLGLLGYVCYRFSEKNNPKPSSVTHNTWLEIVWTTVPVLILVLIAVPSMRLLYYVERIPDAENALTLKVTGYQWYWGYEYADYDGIAFDSYMLKDEELGSDGVRLLDVDNRVVLPIDTDIRLQITANDVIHAWTIPAFGVKRDAVPGKLNEAWIRIDKPGLYYGQCSELCGVLHGFMPIAVEAVTPEKFEEWVEQAKEKFAAPSSGYSVANSR